MTNEESCLISILTPTLNARGDLPTLVRSLCNQTDTRFNWIVVDGSSKDGTQEYLRSLTLPFKVIIDSTPDFGIYDALNRGLRLIKSDYYLVVGADDRLMEDSVARFISAFEGGVPDFIASNFIYKNKIISKKNPCWEWLYAQRAYVAGHALSLLIRTDLHKRVGLYSKNYPIAADQLFILRSVRSAAKIHYINYVSGIFGDRGISSVDLKGAITESFRIQVEMGASKMVQIILLTLRLLKNINRL